MAVVLSVFPFNQLETGTLKQRTTPYRFLDVRYSRKTGKLFSSNEFRDHLQSPPSPPLPPTTLPLPRSPAPSAMDTDDKEWRFVS